jgi:hypothetical protein
MFSGFPDPKVRQKETGTHGARTLDADDRLTETFAKKNGTNR